MASPGGSDGKESARNVGDPGSIHALGRSPEKEIATHSSILAWRIPWTEEPGGPQSMGSQRVGHDLVTKQQQLSIRLIFPTLTTQQKSANGQRIECL